MASIPFFTDTGAHKRRRRPLSSPARVIVIVAIGFAILLLWSMVAQVDEVTRGQGKVIPSSKVLLGWTTPERHRSVPE